MPHIISSGSKQYIVEPGQKIIVDRLKVDEGEVVDLPVLLSFGADASATSVKAKVVSHQKGDKMRVVKYKSKSNYHRQYGYRHYETVLEIEGGSSKKATTTKKTSAKKDDAVAKTATKTKAVKSADAKPAKKPATKKASTKTRGKVVYGMHTDKKDK